MTDHETRTVLKTALLVLKAQTVEISSLRVDVGAIRHALIELTPDYKGVVDRHRSKHIEELRGNVQQDLERLQAIINRLEHS